MLGAHVLQARTGTGALAYVETQDHIDAIVTDLSMPHMDGVEMVQRVRRHRSRASLPAIAVIGFYEQYMDTKAAAFNAFLRKPVDFDEL